MRWRNEPDDDEEEEERGNALITPPITPPIANNNTSDVTNHMIKLTQEIQTLKCPSCSHNIQLKDQGGFHDLPGLPAGVKFDPSDLEILEHLEAKVMSDSDHHVCKLHPLIDDFIPTLQGDNGICCTHPEKLPGVSKDGQIRHFFHRPSKAYTTGTRKRRKVHTGEEGSETRWHKTGKTKPVFSNDHVVKGFKKILVLYTNYGKQKKPEKTNWVMHQYHLGSNEEEKDGELVLSKVFYQTQPRHSGNSIIREEDSYEQIISNSNGSGHGNSTMTKNLALVECYSAPYINYEHDIDRGSSPQLVSNFVVQGDGSINIRLPMDAKKARLERKQH